MSRRVARFPQESAASASPWWRAGVERQSAGDLAGAWRYFSLALTVAPADPRVLADAGNLLRGAGVLTAAAALLARATRLFPDDATVLLLWIAARLDGGDVAACGGAVRRLLAMEPDNGAGWAALARHHQSLSQLSAALTALERACVSLPGRAQSWGDLANLRHQLKSPGVAAAQERSLALLPANEAFLYNLAAHHQDQDRLSLADRGLRRVLRLDREHAPALSRRGMIAITLADRQAATRYLTAALVADPSYVDALNGMGVLLERTGADRLWLDRAVRIQPDHGEARFNRALALLWRGALAPGWHDYGWRFASLGYVEASMPQPRWRGENLAGRHILVLREQGVGDECLFSHFLPALAASAGRVTVECDERLLSLLSRSLPGIGFVGRVRPDNGADVYCYAGDLPGFFGNRLSLFSLVAAGWLIPDPSRVTKWRSRLDRLGEGLKVGLAWRSGLSTTYRNHAYTALLDWLPLAEVPGLQLVNLQYGDSRAELAAAGDAGLMLRGWDDIDLKNDFEEVAALVSCLDLVICPATAVGELAGALGVPTWRVGGQDWTFLGTAVRPWFAGQRPVVPRPGETLAMLPHRIAAALRQLSVTPPSVRQKCVHTLDDAVAAYRAGNLVTATEIAGELALTDRTDAGARHLLGLIANRQEQPRAALAPLIEAFSLYAIQQRPEQEAAAAALFVAFTRLVADMHAAAQWRDSQRLLHRAVVLRPDHGLSWSNLALAISRAGDSPALALSLYRRALRLDPKHAVAHHNAGLLLLEQGRLAEGWAEYDWRFATPSQAGQGRRLAPKLWRGENIRGRRLAIWREQGVGDEILFSALYREAIRRAGATTIFCDPRLVSLFQRSFPDARCVAAETPVADDAFDWHIPAGSLARWLRPTVERFTVATAEDTAWLTADPRRVARWQRRLDALEPGLKIGIAWRSQRVDPSRADAYLDVCDWLPLARLPGVQLINLQYGDVADDLRRFEAESGVGLIGWRDLDLTHDFENVAALICGLDLVLSPATAVGELAGALGTPVWRIGRRDWTWLGTGARPWFPAMRLWAPVAGETLSTVPRRIARALRHPLPAPSPALGALPAPFPTVSAPDLEPAFAALETGNAQGAVALFAAALKRVGETAAVWSGLGAALADLGRTGAARKALQRALALMPADAAALTTLGNVSLARGNADIAVTLHRRATVTTPELLPAWDNWGVALLAAGDDQAAVACHRRVLKDAPLFLPAWINLAAALRQQGKWGAAWATLLTALVLAPDDPDILANMTRLLRHLRDNALDDPWSDRAFRLDPQSPIIAFNRGIALLTAGRLAAGWAGYDRRYEVADTARAAAPLSLPFWRGELLAGRRIVVWGEQGIGDQIMFARLLPALVPLAEKVAVVVDPRLVPLFQASFPNAEIVAEPKSTDWSAIEKAADVQVAMGSLPRWLAPALGDFLPLSDGAGAGYLKVAPALRDKWRRRLDDLTGGRRKRLSVGLAWRSGVMTGDRRSEYTSLSAWRPLLTLPGVTVVNLMYGAEAELAALAMEGGPVPAVWPDLDLKNDLHDVAALMAGLDLVIAPATSAGEMAAALGVPTWRLAVRNDWSCLGAAVRPWFSTMRVFSPEAWETMDMLAGRVVATLGAMTQGAADSSQHIG